MVPAAYVADPVDGVTCAHKMAHSQIVGVIFLVLPQFLQNCLFAQGRKPCFDSYHCDIYDWYMIDEPFEEKIFGSQSFCFPFQQCLGSWSSLLKRWSPLSLLLGPCCLLLFQGDPGLCLVWLPAILEWGLDIIVFTCWKTLLASSWKGQEGTWRAQNCMYLEDFQGASPMLLHHETEHVWKLTQATVHYTWTHPSPQKLTTHTHSTSCVASSICASSSNVNIFPHPTQNTAPCDQFDHTSSVTGLQWC